MTVIIVFIDRMLTFVQSMRLLKDEAKIHLNMLLALGRFQINLFHLVAGGLVKLCFQAHWPRMENIVFWKLWCTIRKLVGIAHLWLVDMPKSQMLERLPLIICEGIDPMSAQMIFQRVNDGGSQAWQAI